MLTILTDVRMYIEQPFQYNYYEQAFRFHSVCIQTFLRCGTGIFILGIL